MDTPEDRVTSLVQALANGDGSAFDELLPLVYDELLSMARRIAGQRDGTLAPTALVHEVFLRFRSTPNAQWEGRSHFLAVAARAMRQLLSDHARRRGTLKRGALYRRVTLDEDFAARAVDGIDLLDLDAAISQLGELDERQAHIVELRYFGGLHNAEIAKLLGLSERMIELDLQMARVFLRKKLDDPEPRP